MDTSPDILSLFSAHNSQLNGFYRQEVIQNNDPLKAGRIQIKVYGLMDNIPASDLPWADPLIPFVGEGYGIVNIPQVGSQVAIMFEQGNIYRPFYFAQIQKNTAQGYLPDYNNYSITDQGNTFITKYPQKFNPPNQFESIIYETTQSASIVISSVYADNRFNFSVQNNPNHINHILTKYTGNDIIITESSDNNSSTFLIQQGKDFSGINTITIKQDLAGGEILVQTVNPLGIANLILSPINTALNFNTSFINMTSQHILLGGVSKVYIGTPTTNPLNESILTLQYQQALQEVRDTLQQLINAFNAHTHTTLSGPTSPPITPYKFLGYTTTLGTTTTMAW